MSTLTIENDQQTVPLTKTVRALTNHPQETFSRPNDHYDTLESYLLTPNTATSGQAPNSQTWPNPHFHMQYVPPVHFYSDGPPISYPPFPSELSNHPDQFPHFPSTITDQPVLVPNSGPSTYSIQNWFTGLMHCAPPCNNYPSMNYSQTPLHVNVNASNTFPVGASLGYLNDVALTTCAQSSQDAGQPALSRPASHQPPLPHGPLPPENNRNQKTGKEPAAEFEPDPVRLRESCVRYGGSAYAVDWIPVVFKPGVTKEALVRALDRNEIGQMDFPRGFEPRQAYDGFISKIGTWYECGLCKEGKRARWKNKKDAPRHLRKFHFGLGDPCNVCGKNVYSNGEIKTHRCAWPMEQV